MQTDRTTKSLLFLIAVALWGILLKPLFAPQPSVAQGLTTPVRIVGVDTAVPVALVRQTVPLEVRTAKEGVVQVEITGQQGVLNVKSAP